MLREVLISTGLVLMIISSGKGCNETPTLPDKIISKRTPDISSKSCWEFRIARHSNESKVNIICVAKETWDRYNKGDKYP